ncbi:MAG: glycosyltransferase [Sarcina sp.]
MLLSIIVPVYNVEAYIEKCLESLVVQKVESFEIICVDDGSTDKSLGILYRLENKYPKIIKVFSKENAGLADTRNFGVEQAKGKYLGFVDSDDWVSKNMFSDMLEKALKDKSEIVICDYIEVYKNENKYIEDKANSKMLYESLVCNKIFERSLFTKYNIKFPVGLWYEDNAVTYKLLFLASKVCKIDEGYYFYRRTRSGSIMNSQKSSKIYDMWEISDNLYRFFLDFQLSDQEKKEIEYIFLRNTMFRQIPKIIKYEGINILKTSNMVKKNFEVLENKFPNWEKNEMILEDENLYYRNKIGKNHIRKIKKIKKNYFNIFTMMLLKEVGY